MEGRRGAASGCDDFRLRVEEQSSTPTRLATREATGGDVANSANDGACVAPCSARCR